MEESQGQAPQPAGSKARKLWEPEEESLLLQLRQQNPRASWRRMQVIFNENLHSSRHRTPDALACKYKTIKPRDLVQPSELNPSSQQGIAPDWCPQLLHSASTTSDDVPFVNGGLFLEGLGINIPIEENEADWAACWDNQIDTDGYLNHLLEAEENAAAMSARATAAAVGGSLHRYPGLEMAPFTFPAELISARRNGSG